MIFFLEILVLLLIGFGIGSFGTLIGAGGGFFIVPLLIVFYNFEPRLAVGTSLVVVFFNALSGTFSYLKQKRVDIKIGSVYALFTIPGAIIGAYITTFFESNLFKIIFAGILIASSIYLIIKPLEEVYNLKIRDRFRRLIDNTGKEYIYSIHIWRGLLISFFIGFISSIFGIGGGIIHVPVLIFFIGFPVHLATATSHFILSLSSLVGSFTHFSIGNVNIYYALIMSIGAIIGAQIGAFISTKTKSKNIGIFLGLALLIVAFYLIFQIFSNI